ncbi:MAG: CopG family transcriptional regulator [Lachnospiraceae bacterium]|nr:CopG family transcriptional regulator [Lachnospiraceae bacterium]
MRHGSLIIKPKKAKGEDGYKVFSIRIKEEIVVQIDDISTKTGHSRNELIGTFLEYALDKCVIEGEKD